MSTYFFCFECSPFTCTGMFTVQRVVPFFFLKDLNTSTPSYLCQQVKQHVPTNWSGITCNLARGPISLSASRGDGGVVLANCSGVSRRWQSCVVPAESEVPDRDNTGRCDEGEEEPDGKEEQAAAREIWWRIPRCFLFLFMNRRTYKLGKHTIKIVTII